MVFLVFMRTPFHSRYQFKIAILVSCPSWNNTPKVTIATTNFSDNNFALSPVNDSDNSPVLNFFRLLHTLLSLFNFKTFHFFLILLKSSREFYQRNCPWQKLKSHYLGSFISFSPGAFVYNVLKTLRCEMYYLLQSF